MTLNVMRSFMLWHVRTCYIVTLFHTWDPTPSQWRHTHSRWPWSARWRTSEASCLLWGPSGPPSGSRTRSDTVNRSTPNIETMVVFRLPGERREVLLHHPDILGLPSVQLGHQQQIWQFSICKLYCKVGLTNNYTMLDYNGNDTLSLSIYKMLILSVSCDNHHHQRQEATEWKFRPRLRSKMSRCDLVKCPPCAGDERGTVSRVTDTTLVWRLKIYSPPPRPPPSLCGLQPLQQNTTNTNPQQSPPQPHYILQSLASVAHCSDISLSLSLCRTSLY